MVRCSFGSFAVAVLLYPSSSCSYSYSGDANSTYYSASTSNCSNPSCLALAAEYPNCTGFLPWIGDGYCDPILNSSPCGYDGGDCCECTCVDGPDYACGENSFSCITPDGAKDDIYGCAEPGYVLPCPKGTPRYWVVEDTASAQALAGSVNCSGGVFEVEWNGNVVVDSTFYLVDGTVLNITGSGLGAGVYGTSNAGLFVVDNASIHVTDLSISHNGNASGVIAVAGSSVVFDRTVFCDNSATANGGAVFVSKNTSVSFAGDTFFFNNSAGRYGGALFVSDGSSISFAGDATFSNNSGWAGGAVFVSDGSSAFFAGDTLFSNNNADLNGGAVLVSDDSSVIFAGERSSSYNNSGSSGGILEVSEAFDISWSGETTFLNNNAGKNGGGLHVTLNSRFTWIGQMTLEGNTVLLDGGRGGGVYTSDGGHVSWSGNTTFINNLATLDGGALYAQKGSTVSWSEHTSFLGNSASYGGAIYIRGSTASWSVYSYFFNNKAGILGGALHATAQSNAFWSGDAVWSENSAQYGGAIFINEGSVVSWSGRTEFVSNRAEFNGGAVGSIVYDLTKNHEDSLLSINGPTMFANNTCGANGGGLAVLGALPVTLKETAVSFVGNSAGSAGGGLYLSGAGVGPLFTNVSFISNVAQVGGAVFATGSGNDYNIADGAEDRTPTIFQSCRFIGNEATATGGAIETASGKDFVMDSLFMGNTAGVGGALRLAGTAFVSNCSFIENVSDEEGGMAISNIGSVMQMENNSFVGNTFNCEIGTFLDYSESRHVYDTACDGCVLPCTGCFFEEPPLAPVCTDVMAHATSSGGSITVDRLSIDRGYWRATTVSVDILACYNAEACLGGETGTSSYCHKGYEGPYCSICSNGYGVNLGFSCSECLGGTGGIVLGVVVPVVVLFAAVVIVLYLMSGELEDAGTGFVDRARRYLSLQSVKIVVVVWQIITQFTAVANVTYPNVYQRFLDGVDVLNFDLSWIISAGCVVDYDFHSQLLMSTMGPIIAMLLLGATYAIAVRHNSGSEDALRIVLHKHVSMALLLTFLVYSSVSSTLFQMYGCENLDDGKNYLRADYRIECDSSKHKTLLIYTGFMIALYTVGIPALYAGLLFTSRDVLKDHSGREYSLRAKSISDLWKPYKPACFYYEVIECARRMLLAGAVVFIYPNTAAQIAVTLMMAMFFVFVSEGLAPYELSWDRWVNRMGHAIVLTSMYLALLLKVDVSKERASSQKVFEAILVSAHACMVLTVVAEVVLMACRVTRETQKETKPRPRLPKFLETCFDGRWRLPLARR